MFSKITIAIRFNLLQVCPSVPPFVISVIYTFFSFVEQLSLCFTETGGSSRYLNFDTFHDTGPSIGKELIHIVP